MIHVAVSNPQRTEKALNDRAGGAAPRRYVQ